MDKGEQIFVANFEEITFETPEYLEKGALWNILISVLVFHAVLIKK